MSVGMGGRLVHYREVVSVDVYLDPHASRQWRNGFLGFGGEWHCSRCGKEVPADSEECPFCKTPFGQDSEQELSTL